MTRWTTFLRESLSRAAVTWQNLSLWEDTRQSWKWASTAANHATGVSTQKAGSFNIDITAQKAEVVVVQEWVEILWVVCPVL